MLKKLLLAVTVLMFLTGCGVNIKLDGNKIYTDTTKDEAFNFANAALKTKGYKVIEESKINHYITASPKYNETFKIEKADKEEVAIYVKDSDKANETVVNVIAIANGQIDEEKSKEIAQKAVAEIITELDKYGKFNAEKQSQYVYQIATLSQVFDFAANYFSQNNIPIEQNLKDNGLIYVKEANSSNPFNDPLQAEIAVATDETNKITVGIKAHIKGNYDVAGNQQYVNDFVSKFMDYLASYPLVEKGLRYSYKFISFDKAFVNTQAALKDSGFSISEADKNNYVLSAQKDNIKLSSTLTEINYNTAVNLEAMAESATLTTTKEALTESVTNELNTLSNALALYQTSVTGTKLYTSTSQDNVLKYIKIALQKAGYSYKMNKADLSFSATSLSNSNLAHFILVNNLGQDGISIEINTLYNTKYKGAEALVKKENEKLLNILHSFDKSDVK